MATVSIVLQPADMQLLVGLLAAGADPLTDADPELAPRYRDLGSALIEAVILRVRGPAVLAELAAARAAVQTALEGPRVAEDHA